MGCLCVFITVAHPNSQYLLAASSLPYLAQAPPPLPPAEVSAKAGVMNERHRTAKRAQKDCRCGEASLQPCCAALHWRRACS